MKQLRSAIKNNTLPNLHLFCGEELFLLIKYETAILKKYVSDFQEMNVTVIEGNKASVQNIIDAAETLPFMCDKRVVIVKDSGLFATGRKDDSTIIADYLAGYNNDMCILIFREHNIDKRGKAYKVMKTNGKITEFNPLTEGELSIWHSALLKEHNISLPPKDAAYLFRICGGDMEKILKETEKLTAYKSEGLINKDDIDALCTKTSEARIFDLVDAIGEKNAKQALLIYNELLAMKETPAKIISLISRQFRLILKSSLLQKKGKGNEVIAKVLEERPFVIKICLAQARNFNIDALKSAVLDAVTCDTRIKSGLSDPRISVEMLIIKYTN